LHLTYFPLVLLLSCFCGCINGPARMHLNGKLRYITAETMRRCSWKNCLYGVPAAAITDLGIIVADTLLVPLDVYYRGPYDDGCSGIWVIWLPFYPCVCAVQPFAYQEKPANGALYRRYWGFSYMDSINGTLQLFDLEAPPARRTRIFCNNQKVSEILGQIESLTSSQNHLAVLTSQGRLYWWICDDTGWRPQQHNYIPSSNALLEYGMKRLAKAKLGTVKDDYWRRLQELMMQMPVEYRFGQELELGKENKLFYDLFFIYPAGEICVSCSILPGVETPQIYNLYMEKSSYVP